MPEIVWWAILACGLSYTLSVVFFVREKPSFAHAIWHVVFVMGGTAVHFVAVSGALQ